MYPNRFFLYLLTLLLFFGVCAHSQNVIRNNVAHSSGVNAQNMPELLKEDNLSQVTSDQISDNQISLMRTQLQANGISIDQAEQIALSKGLAPNEWQKIKSRLTQSTTKLNEGNAEPVAVPSSVRQSVGNDYQVYQKSVTSAVFGSSFFNTPSLSFEPNLRIATPVNYVLGPDDELLISVSGYQETNIRTTVQPEGTIYIPQVGSIMLNGLTIEEANARIKDKMSHTAYPSLVGGQSKLSISLSKIRSIHVTVIGAAKPGNYTVSSLATVFNCLYLCGGPGDINTYRDIELIRNNHVIEKIDIYQFLTRGDQKGNIPLRENDVINFPVYKKHVSIKGQVKREGIFELKEGETLNSLLYFAGGFSDKAYRATIKVKQITDTERKIKDIAKAEYDTYKPENGDEFQVDAILERFENAVSINGAVFRPGEFELTPGLTLGGLIKRAGGLQENVFTDRAILTRSYPDGRMENITFNVSNILNGSVPDIKLIKRDSVVITYATALKTSYTVEIQGEVRNPGQYVYKENLSLKDLLFNANGFTDAASTYNIEVSRRLIRERKDKSIDSIATVFNISTDKALAIENNRFILQPYDIVTVRRNPGYMQQQRVAINGEVNFPGTYTIESRNERVSSLIKRAGGLTSLAYTKGVYLIRNNVETDTANRSKIKTIQSSIRDTSAKTLAELSMTNNKVAININKIMAQPGSVEDYTLEDGDQIQVLKADPLVKINGAVLSTTKTGYRAGKSLGYYLSQAGGTTEDARRSKIYVVYEDGSINRTHNGVFGVFRSYPKVDEGSEIIVPRKTEKPGLTTTERIGLTSALLSIVSLVIITISNLKK